MDRKGRAEEEEERKGFQCQLQVLISPLRHLCLRRPSPAFLIRSDPGGAEGRGAASLLSTVASQSCPVFPVMHQHSRWRWTNLYLYRLMCKQLVTSQPPTHWLSTIGFCRPVRPATINLLPLFYFLCWWPPNCPLFQDHWLQFHPLQSCPLSTACVLPQLTVCCGIMELRKW